MIINIIKSLRPGQWTKNLVVFAGLIFSRSFFDGLRTIHAVIAFVCFCLAAGAIYLINDVTDREKDVLHPVKKNRPVAAGTLSVSSAVIAAICLISIVVITGCWIDLGFGLLLTAYIVLQLLYSLGLKNIIIIDLLLVVAGFIIRVAAGAVIIHVEISYWLIICAGILALFLILCKRRQTALLNQEMNLPARSVFRYYTPDILSKAIIIVAGMALIAYTWYTVSARTIAHVGSPVMVLTVPFVVIGMSRYLWLVFKAGKGQRPEKLLLTDLVIILDIFGWLTIIIWLLYCG